jgi:adenylate cyclase
MNSALRRGALAALVALIWAALIATPNLRGSDDIFETLEGAFFDWRVLTFGAREPPEPLVIVALDDATLAASTIGQQRQQLTDVVNAIADSGARVLALDILLTDSGPATLDARLSGALGRASSIVAGAAGAVSTGGGMGLPHVSQELWPQQRFLEAADVGLVNIITGPDGSPRYVPTVFATSRGILPSFALRSASEFTGVEPELSVSSIRLGDRSLFLDHDYLLPLRPYGPAGTIRTVSAMELLAGDAGPVLAGKLVVLGNTATGLGDRFPSPFGSSLTGAEVTATAIGQFIEPQQVMMRSAATRRIDALMAVALAISCTLSVLAFPLVPGVALAGAIVIASLSGVWIAFAYGIWLAAAVPLAAAGGPAILAAIWRYAGERSQALATDRMMKELRKFQSPQLARLVEENPAYLSKPETTQATILFVDLAGFTAISQSLGPEDTELLLKRFHRCVTKIVQKHGGLVFNYMGDGALAAFGLLENGERADPEAVAAAFELVERVPALDQEGNFGSEINCRVGLHFGTVVLSRLGDDLHQQFSVSGDSVNLTSRLLEVAKEEDASIAATAVAVPEANTHSLRKPVAHRKVTLRGRHGEVDVLLWRS